MVQNVSVCFYPKKRQGDGDLVYVYLRITVRKEGSEKPDKVELSTGKRIDIRRWSAVTNRLVGKSDDVKAANDYFSILDGKVNNAHNLLLRMDHEVTAEKIKLLVEGKPLEPIRTILPVFKELVIGNIRRRFSRNLQLLCGIVSERPIRRMIYLGAFLR